MFSMLLILVTVLSMFVVWRSDRRLLAKVGWTLLCVVFPVVGLVFFWLVSLAGSSSSSAKPVVVEATEAQVATIASEAAAMAHRGGYGEVTGHLDEAPPVGSPEEFWAEEYWVEDDRWEREHVV